jgi:hypothetical protein
MADAHAFTKLVPGFDFLQGLVKNAGSALPSIGQWVAPTVSPEELEKRIEELRTVQFWLEQNARMLGATIQALEVQRMTLATLRTMNVQMSDLSESLRIRVPSAPAQPSDGAAASSSAGSGEKNPKRARPAAGKPAQAAADAAPVKGAVDPMQWWGALTKQFSELAASAIRDSAAEATAPLAGAAARQGAPSAEQAFKKAAAAPRKKPAAAARKRSANNEG